MLLWAVLFAGELGFVSYPRACMTVANPAWTGVLSDYACSIRPTSIGQLDYFAVMGKFGDAGLGFSGAGREEGGRSFASLAYSLSPLLRVGGNVGLDRRWSDTEPFFDLGVSVTWFAHAGFVYSGFYSDDPVIRLGVSGRYRGYAGTVELIDSLERGNLTPVILATYTFRRGPFIIELGPGYRPSRGLAYSRLALRDMVECAVYYDGQVRCELGLRIHPRIQTREIVRTEWATAVETLYVERVVERVQNQQERPVAVSEEALRACESRYLKGIEFYLDDRIGDAIKEWEAVAAIDPDYKDVRRYLKNALEKQRLLND